MSKKAYNFTVKQITTAERSTIANGTSQIKFRGELTLRGETRTRTVVAQGKAAELISGMVRKNATMDLRVLFERAPSTEEGQRGGEFLSVVGLPEAKKAA